MAEGGRATCYASGRLAVWLLIVLLSVPGNLLRGQITQPNQGPAVSWRKLIRNVCEDQKSIWVRPFRPSRQDLKPWVLFGSATAVLVATDKRTSRQLPNTPDQIRVSNITSRPGAAYALYPGVMALYAGGVLRGDDRMREAGILGGEALTDAFLVGMALKVATNRERPLENAGSGRFWKGSGKYWNFGSSFPSSHSTQIWAVASVVAHEYPRPRIIPVIAYGLAASVSASRFTARRHFASDAVAGAAIGWFIGNYVFHRRHRPEVEPRRYSPPDSRPQPVPPARAEEEERMGVGRRF